MGMYDPPPRQGQNFIGRFLLALVIAIIGLISYMSHVEKNPVTGEKQHVAISPTEEIRLGLESAPTMSQKMGGELPSSDPRVLNVKAMGQYLVSNTVAKDSPWKFHFHLLADSKTVNAFALPGGQIFITLGLYDKLQTEAQLAGVLGHEMGHVIERHSAEQMAKSQFGQALVIAFGTAASDRTNTPFVIGQVVNQMIQLRYSRKDELEADLWGLKLMSEAGFTPVAMLEVMKILKASSASSGHSMEMFQTHPNPDLRMKDIEEYLKANPPSADLTEGQALHSAKSNS